MAELTQTRKVELLVCEVDLLGPCCSCREKEGVLKCSGCKAVAYCGEECQEEGWNDHKDVCIEINQLLQQVNAAIEALANEYGDIEALLEAPLVKDGRFGFRDRFLSSEDPRNFRFNVGGPTIPEKYDIARWKLINAYARCGKEASSKLAFRLAAENLIHMFHLCRNSSPHMSAFTWHKHCGWMVAGEMDQQALNFLGYIQSRAHRHDLSVQEDIEGLSVVSRVKEMLIPPFALRFKVHDFMLISLIKYKRIKALSVLRKEEEEMWNTFMEGTESRSGESSVVLILSGMAPVLEKLKGFVVDKEIDERIYSLTNQINDLLIEVNKENPKLIQGVLDGHVQMGDNHHEYFSHYGYTSDITDMTDNERKVHISRFAVRKYGYAWHIDNDCTTALRLFLETGTVMEEEEEGNSLQTEIEEEDISPETGTAGEDTSPDKEDISPQTKTVEENTTLETGMDEKEDTSPETKMVEENTSPETGMTKEEDNSPGTLKQDDKVANLGAILKMKENLVNESQSNAIKVDEATFDDRERDRENSVEEKEGLGLSDLCDDDNEFKGFSGKVKEKEDKGIKDDKNQGFSGKVTEKEDKDFKDNKTEESS